ncbi:MAG: T9SS type A sorting domain-containing protein [Hymenobacteraceae bacterium]|nr:T9SS type A sorting domain-containing protein [Hymenobacteraceae bacterium]MDX5395849.1 T9SS type A sorting domain-containing protein [Hymenobacteraceae bacterium]MDX5442652.1 T9SS type A sorting domain-containing protein [Hymenobacteraceae bacterium]MDX5511904.1 T9SS type A sorting domain-containing protein [Hymenobacteraceae bacterium]
MENFYIKNMFSKTKLAAVAAGLFLLGATEAATAQSQFQKLLNNSKNNQTTASSGKVKANARINNMLSLPGNSMDYYPDGNGGWYHSGNSTYKYDTKGNLISRIEKDPSGQYTRRDSIVYDAQGNQIYEGNFSWINNSWDVSWQYKNLNTYNANNQITEKIVQSWNTTTNMWENDWRDVTTYNTAGKISSNEEHTWDGTAWVTDSRNLYDYAANPAGNPSTITYQEYVNGNWVNYDRYTNIVWQSFSDFKPLSYTEENWDNGTWVVEGRGNIVYDNNGGSVEVFQQFINNTWVNSDRWSSLYDSRKNEVGYMSEDWVNNAWVMDWQEEYLLTYNATDDVTQKIVRSWDISTNQLEDRRKEVYSNFTRIAVGVQKQLQQLQVNVYPNPATAQLTLQAETADAAVLTLTDLAGRVVITKALDVAPATTHQVDVANLAKGTYLLQLQTAKGIYTTKIVKQ